MLETIRIRELTEHVTDQAKVVRFICLDTRGAPQERPLARAVLDRNLHTQLMLDCSILNLHPDLSAPSVRSTPQEAVDASLSLAHSYAAQGNTTAALQVVFETLRTFYGDTAAQSAAARVESELLHLHLQPQQPSAQSAADQLADVFNGCRICKTQPAQLSEQHASLEAGMQQLNMQSQPPQYDSSHKPLLMELRGMRLAEPGDVDDSSVMCQWCGGIVSRSREAAHRQFWCQPSRQ